MKQEALEGNVKTSCSTAIGNIMALVAEALR